MLSKYLDDQDSGHTNNNHHHHKVGDYLVNIKFKITNKRNILYSFKMEVNFLYIKN